MVSIRMWENGSDRATVIRSFQESSGKVVIGFHDGSVLKIREMETNSPPVPAGAQIKQVEEDGTEFRRSPIPSAPAWGLIAAIGGIPLGMKMKVRVSWLNPTGPRISQQWSELQRSRFRASR